MDKYSQKPCNSCGQPTRKVCPGCFQFACPDCISYHEYIRKALKRMCKGKKRPVTDIPEGDLQK